MAPVHDNPEFLPEVWTLYGIGVVVFALRFFVRIRTVGLSGFCGDDYFAILSVFFLTIDGVVVDRAFLHGTAVEFTKEQLDAMTQAEIDSIGIGSKFEFMGWFSYPGLIWSMKAMMLFFYGRLTFRLWQQRLVRWLSLIIFASYIAMLSTIVFSCRPFTHNWQVRPQPSLECTFHPQNVAVVSILNIATDVALLSVPIPLLWTVHAQLKKKVVMGCFLLGGVLVIVAAIVRVIVTLGSNPSTVTINLWGIRETVIAVLAVNAPVLRPLFTRRFWSLTSEPTELISCGATNSSNSSQGRPTTLQKTYTSQTTGGVGKLPVIVERVSKERDSLVISPNGCTEDVGLDELSNKKNKDTCGGVVVEVEVQVESERRNDRDSGRDAKMGNSTWAKGWI
ncbi:hypothetical protein MPH_01341 [Macrophomina phaseolina MS6]|uniref:Rhodopsin domain-containing protein n=1 Tax=Macrophomina phaseolina (strain MS6) TaxID=1126212 RepID=K2SFY0_MACPH|nr:hypothetical protein MPH_01341 [Macrophomina phaseolina MS6]